MNKDEVERTKRDAESHAEEDRRKKDLLDARNEADSVTWQIEKMMKENGDKISEQDKAPIQAAIEKVRSTANGEDPAAIKQAISELTQASQAMAQHLQSQSQGGPNPNAAGPQQDGAAGGKAKGDDDVIDTDYEVKK